MIEFQGVHKWFKNLHVLNDINLHVTPGEVLVVCGPSGSGKSTLIRTINQLEPINEGSLIVDGMDLSDKKPISISYGRRSASFSNSSTCILTSRLSATSPWLPLKSVMFRKKKPKSRPWHCLPGSGSPRNVMHTRHNSPAASSSGWQL